MNPPKMPIHIGDLYRDTGHLRAPGFGGYLALMFHYWSTGGLPDDDGQLAAIARMTKAEWRKHKPIIKAFFKDGWKHKRIDHDLRAARERHGKLAEAGKRGGQAKAKPKPGLSEATAGLDENRSQAQATLEPLNHLKKEEETAGAVSPPSKFVFESGIIRLTQKHFDEWHQAFSYLDLRAELIALTPWAEQPSQREKWFFAVAGALAKRNREAKGAREAPQLDANKIYWGNRTPGIS